MKMFEFRHYSSRQGKIRIEDDLVARRKKVNSRIQALRIKQMKAEMKNVQNAPTINSNSIRLASKSQKSISYCSTRVERTYKLLKNSQFLPKKVNLSMDTLRIPPLDLRKSLLKSIKYDMLYDPYMQTPNTFPSLENLNSKNNNSENLPPDIIKRNDLLLS